MAFTEPLEQFFDTATGFAVNAMYDGSVSVAGFYGASAGDAFGVGANVPEFIVASGDIDIDPRGKTLVVEDVSYTVREFELDLTGRLCTLKLEAV